MKSIIEKLEKEIDNNWEFEKYSEYSRGLNFAIDLLKEIKPKEMWIFDCIASDHYDGKSLFDKEESVILLKGEYESSFDWDDKTDSIRKVNVYIEEIE